MSHADVKKNDIGLGNVDNTSDADKPVSTAQAISIATKEPTITAGTTGQYYRGDKTWQTHDKASIGLSSVDNTSDVGKPVSTAQAASIGTKLTTPAGSTSQYMRGDATLATFPSIPAIQIQSDMTQTSTSSLDYVKNKNQTWRSGTRKYTIIDYTTSSVVSGGTATFNLTDDGTSGGNALATTWYKESANFWVEDNTSTYQFGSFTVSANKKQVTATITKLGTTSTILSLISVLTGITFVAPANGLTVYLTIKGE